MKEKILYLPLEKEWYEMIERGEKLEEYREIKEHWIKRICKSKKLRSGFCCEDVDTDITHVCFSYGYTKRRMLKKVLRIYIGYGKIDWGAPKLDKVFIIELEKK